MKKMANITLAAILFIFLFSCASLADELSDLKKQFEEMQKQLTEQKKEIRKMQQKIRDLEVQNVHVKEKPVSAEAKTPEDSDLHVYFKDGVRLETEDKNFKLKLGGRIQADFGWMGEDSEVKGRLGNLDSAAEIRRLRAYASGSVFQNTVYKTQLDFADGEVSFADVYIGFQNVPLLELVRIGQFTEPFSLEDMTSSNDITFLERSLPYALSLHRNTGVGFNSTHLDDRLTFSASAFYNADSLARPISNAINAATRLTGLPFYENDGEKLLHLGVAYSFRNPPNKEQFSYSSKPEIHLAPNFVDTGDFDAKFANLLGLESALVYGPLSLQGELIQSFVNLDGTSSVGYFNGFYVSASYFLTGEHREYNKFWATFSNAKPYNNFSIKEQTFGALELAARYSYLDLSTQDINGRALYDITVGLNWYLNPATKVMLNYVHSHPNGVGDADIIAVRCQFYY